MQSSDATLRGRELARAGRLDEALAAFLDAVARDGRALDAHLGIYEVAQILRRPELALAHQAAAIAIAPVHSTPASEREDYALLSLRARPLHRQHPGRPAVRLPPRHAAPLVRRSGRRGAPAPASTTRSSWRSASPTKPRRIWLRSPRFVAASRVRSEPARHDRAAGRVPLAETFAGARYCRVVTTTRIARDRYGADGFPLPHIVRPVGSHGGHGLELIEDDAQRTAYLSGRRAAAVRRAVHRLP